MRLLYALTAALALLAAPAMATDKVTSTTLRTAGPPTVAATLRTAKCGERVVLAAGDYGAVTVPKYTCTEASRVEVDASQARMTSLMIRGVTGLDWSGGRLLGSPDAVGAGVTIDASRFIRVSGMYVTGSKVGVTAIRGTDYEIVGNRFEGLRSDGVNVALAQRVLIASNQCLDFRPIRATYDAKGKLITDGDHADCVQGWSRLGQTPTGDITVTGNYARGEMQGYSFFDPNQGGYDRIRIIGNIAEIEYWNGAVVYEGRGTEIRDNVLRTIPGTRSQNYPFQPIKTWVYTLRGVDQKVCGNVTPASPTTEGQQPCK